MGNISSFDCCSKGSDSYEDMPSDSPCSFGYRDDEKEFYCEDLRQHQLSNQDSSLDPALAHQINSTPINKNDSDLYKLVKNPSISTENESKTEQIESERDKFFESKRLWEENHLPVRQLSFLTDNPVYRGQILRYYTIKGSNYETYNENNRKKEKEKEKERFIWIDLMKRSICCSKEPHRKNKDSQRSSRREIPLNDIVKIDINSERDNDKNFEMALFLRTKSDNDTIVFIFESVTLRDLWENEILQLKTDRNYLRDMVSKDF